MEPAPRLFHPRQIKPSTGALREEWRGSIKPPQHFCLGKLTAQALNQFSHWKSHHDFWTVTTETTETALLTRTLLIGSYNQFDLSFSCLQQLINSRLVVFPSTNWSPTEVVSSERCSSILIIVVFTAGPKELQTVTYWRKLCPLFHVAPKVFYLSNSWISCVVVGVRNTTWSPVSHKKWSDNNKMPLK